MGKRIVITGGAGFIGSHLVKKHIDNGDSVCIIDNLSTSCAPKDKECDLLIADLSEPSRTSSLIKLLSDADLVYHLASSVGVRHVDRDPGKAIQNIMKINFNLFPLFEQCMCRVVFASTSEVYGNNTNAKETDELRIGSPEVMRWGYACGKLMSEFLLKSYSFPSTVVRFFNITGAGQLSEHGMVLPNLIQKAKKNDDLIVYGDGSQTRSFCDVRDAIEMLQKINGDHSIGEIYNIGNSENTITIKQLADRVIELTQCRSKITFKKYSDVFSNQSKDINTRQPDVNKIYKLYKPRHNIDSIITSML